MSRINASVPRLAAWRSRGHGVAWSLSALGLVMFSAWLGAATWTEVRRMTRVVPPTPPEVMRDVIVRGAPDAFGRRASFRILLFSDEFRWRLNSFQQLERGVSAPHFTPEMKAVLNDAREIICVGASSEEIPPGVPFDVGREREEHRAARRAEQIALWIRGALTKPIVVRKLNIGHHMPTGSSGDTSDQRRVVIILVLDYDARTDIDDALRSAMAGESARSPIFKRLLFHYSLAAGPAFTWIP